MSIILTEATVENIKGRIKHVLSEHANTSSTVVGHLVDITQNSLQGKLYEAWVVAIICENLVKKEGCRIELVGGTNLTFKQKGSPINREYPYFKVYKSKKLIGELFTDTYFNTLSSKLKGFFVGNSVGDYHELDIVLLVPGVSGTPSNKQVLLAVECKNTAIKKSIIREVLGFRRELSLKRNSERTIFEHWPVRKVCATPSSVHMLYCSDANVLNFTDNCLVFGTLLEHLELPGI